MSIPVIDGIVNAVSSGFKSWNDGRTRIKEAKIQSEIAKYNAEAETYRMALQAETDWDVAALKASEKSWKDEWLTLLLSAPFIGAFIPTVQDYVMKGFEYLDKTPVWYQWSFLGVVAASFGLRWWFNKKNV